MKIFWTTSCKYMRSYPKNNRNKNFKLYPNELADRTVELMLFIIAS